MANGLRPISPRVLLALQALALWPVWSWFWWRMTVCPNEIWEGLPLLAVAALVFFRARMKTTTAGAGCDLRIPALLTLLYAFSFPFVTELPHAVLAFTALTATLSALFFGRSFHLGLWGLMLLSLQLHNGLKFYLGYPLRVFAAAVCAPLLRLSGFSVLREGTCLNWGGQLILIDAPCSGVKMLWAGLFLAFALAAFNNLSWLRSTLVCVCAVAVVVAANILRAAALFFIEADVLDAPAWSHSGIGVLLFALTAMFIVLLTERIQRGAACAASSS